MPELQLLKMLTLREMCPNTKLFLVCNFLYSGSYFPVFSCIQSEYRKIRTRNNSVFGHFSRSVRYFEKSFFEKFPNFLGSASERFFPVLRKLLMQVKYLHENLLHFLCKNQGMWCWTYVKCIWLPLDLPQPWHMQQSIYPKILCKFLVFSNCNFE